MLIRRIATIIIVELIPFMNELSMIVKTPVTTKAIPPARFDSYHAKSLLLVHDGRKDGIGLRNNDRAFLVDED